MGKSSAGLLAGKESADAGLGGTGQIQTVAVSLEVASDSLGAVCTRGLLDDGGLGEGRGNLPSSSLGAAARIGNAIAGRLDLDNLQR